MIKFAYIYNRISLETKQNESMEALKEGEKSNRES